jgi:hypothetical protein
LGTSIFAEKITEITVREYRRGNTNEQSRENGNIGVHKAKKNKVKTLNMCWTALYASKHK